MHIQTLPIESPDYPLLLRQIYDPPQVLYFAGDLNILKRERVAVVGTRRMTAYGEAQAFRFAKMLSEQGLCIVSGLAYGIDRVAHEGALEGEGGTIAVLAQGLPEVQPAAHRELAERIVAKGGLLLCEKKPGLSTYKVDYLIRNRIIAGLCKAVIVVEAPFKSGAMNTATHALENNRDVLALPGLVSEENSQGPHKLIRSGAVLVSSPQEVLQHFGLSFRPRKIALHGLAQTVFDTLRKAPLSPAELGERFPSMAELYAVLNEMELKGLIRFTKDLRYAVVLD